MSKSEIISYIKNVSVILIAFVFLVFPIFFLTRTSEAFIFPKQMLVLCASVILLVLFLSRNIVEGRISIRSGPYNLPVVLLGAAVFISAIVSRSFYDSLLQAVPFLAALVMYFVIVNAVEDKMSYKLILYALVLGGSLSAIITILHYFKVYIFPFQETHFQTFNTFGAIIQQILYLLPLLLIAVFNVLHFRRTRVITYDTLIFAASGIIAIAGIILLTYQVLFASQPLIILPYMYGFQVALASISQDAQRYVLSFLFGSGYGTFATDFTRFKLMVFNQEKDIWNLVFSYSSSYLLELLATTGMAGVLALFFLIFKVLRSRIARSGALYGAILLSLIFAFLLPFSYSMIFLLFALLGMYTVHLYLEKSHLVESVTVSLVALKEGLINFENVEQKRSEKTFSRALPIITSIVIIIVSGVVLYGSVRLFISDIKFRESLVLAGANNGQKAYELQTQAISSFPYKSDYYRVFSQLNLALANSVANAAQQNPDQNQQLQQTVLTLIQQSINSARTSVTYAPMTASNWHNMAQVYRNLINVGQNAEQFSVATIQQAIALDPYNPLYYIELGGIYYQLGNYDMAQSQFQIAIGLKRDLANGYYNLGHALEAKGDMNNALVSYLAVKELVKNDPNNLSMIEKEISVLQAKIGGNAQQAKAPDEVQGEPTENQPPIEVNKPETKLPPQKPPIEIPQPPVTPIVTVTPTPTNASPSVTPVPTVNPTPTPFGGG